MDAISYESFIVKLFLNQMNFLGRYYKVFVKPHSWCFEENRDLKKVISLYKNLELIDDIDAHNELLYMADYVFCDNLGGAVFTAIYCDKNVLLLDTSDVGEYSIKPKVFLKEKIVNFSSDCNGDEILKVLKDEDIWKKQKEIRKSIKKSLFTITKEPASKKIANALVKILNEK